jgi:dynein heavy chain 1
LQGALEAWALSTQSELESQSHSDMNDRNSIFSTIFVDIVLQNQEIIAVPPLPAVRETLLRRFHDFTGAICSLRTIHCDRYEIFKPSDQFDSTKYFSDIMGRISPDLITKSYHNIENNMQRASNVVKYWLEFQILWDKSTTDIIALLGDDVLKWQYFLTDLAATRSGLESPETSATVGHLNIRYDKVKAQISFRYDSWQRDLQSAFANILRRRVAELFDELQSARERLESIHLDGISSSTQDVIHGVTHVKDANGKVTYWQTYIEQLITGERVLRRQRYNFPWDWVESSRLKGLFQTIEQILLKRLQAIEDNRSILQTRILTETKVSALRMTDLISTWELEKPTNATGNAYDALETIAKFELGMKKAQKDEDKLIKAKEALSLDSSSRNMIVIECLTELSNLKELWQFLAKSYGFLQEIKDTLWFNGNVRKIRQQLEDIISGMTSTFS